MQAVQDARKLIRDYYDAFNRGDKHGFLALLTDDVVHDINQGETETGKEAFGRFIDKMNVHYKEQLKDLVVMVDESGARAAAEFVIHGTYLKSDVGLPPAKGQPYRLPVGAFFTLRQGRVARITNYYNLESWLKMVR